MLDEVTPPQTPPGRRINLRLGVKLRCLVASRLLGDGRAPAKHQIAQPGADRHRNHDPAVVRHEDKPDDCQTLRVFKKAQVDTGTTHMIMKA